MKYLAWCTSRKGSWTPCRPASGPPSRANAWPTARVRKNGHYIAAEALQPVRTATTLRVRNGKLSTTDGPFAETKEQLGGFYLVDARDLNEAIQVASRIPPARLGSIESGRSGSSPSGSPRRNTCAIVDGFVVPVPREAPAGVSPLSRKAGKIWREHGALEYRSAPATTSR